uniref:hypothetical protein n=1 Tax=Carnobacterium sp. TaxID=48221 RepID=UPI00344CAF75
MNIRKSNTNSKGLLSIVLFIILVISLVLNGVLTLHLTKKDVSNITINSTEVDEYKKTILSLEDDVTRLNEEVNNANPEQRDSLSKTKIEEQNTFKQVANDFVSQYLTYNTKTLEERRNSIKDITDESLLDKVAPEIQETDKQALSSDPTFTSKVENVKVYIADINNTLGVGNAIIEVTYATKNTEGESKLQSLIYLELKKDENNMIKVTDYTYYPVTK